MIILITSLAENLRGKAFPCLRPACRRCRRFVLRHPFCGDTPQRPAVRYQTLTSKIPVSRATWMATRSSKTLSDLKVWPMRAMTGLRRASVAELVDATDLPAKYVEKRLSSRELPTHI